MTRICPILNTLSYNGKKGIRIALSLITLLCPPVDFTCSILGLPTPNCPHLPLTLAPAHCCKQASGSPPTYDSPSGTSELSHVPLPQPRIIASLLSARQHLSPISKLLNTPILQETSQQDLLSTHKSRGWRKEGWDTH